MPARKVIAQEQNIKKGIDDSLSYIYIYIYIYIYYIYKILLIRASLF